METTPAQTRGQVSLDCDTGRTVGASAVRRGARARGAHARATDRPGAVDQDPVTRPERPPPLTHLPLYITRTQCGGNEALLRRLTGRPVRPEHGRVHAVIERETDPPHHTRADIEIANSHKLRDSTRLGILIETIRILLGSAQSHVARTTCRGGHWGWSRLWGSRGRPPRYPVGTRTPVRSGETKDKPYLGCGAVYNS